MRNRMICGSCRLWIAAVGVACCLVVGVTAARAQDELPVDFVGTTETVMEQTSQGNVVQAALMLCNQGKRDLQRAAKLVEKANSATDPTKRDKFIEKSVAANESAQQQLLEALKKNPKMIECYDALGLAFRRQGKYEEALEIHAIALRRDETSMENFQGWAESLLALNLLGNATQSYTAYIEAGSPRAEILMGEMKKWLEAHQADPGDVDPEHVQRLADWIAKQNQGG